MKSSFRMVSRYLLLAGLWVVLSDRMLAAWLADDPAALDVMRIANGLVLVGASAVLLRRIALRGLPAVVASTPPAGRGKVLLLSFLAFLATLVAGGALVSQREQARVLNRQKAALNLAADHGHMLQTSLDRALSSTYALTAALHQGRGKIDNFDTLARQVLALYPGVSALQLAPDGVISEIFPREGNESALGLNLFANRQRYQAALTAVKQRKLDLVGPFQLGTGQFGIAGQFPVFMQGANHEDRLWGLAIAVVNVSDLLKASRLDTLAADGYEYELWSAQGGTARGFVLAQSSKRLLEQATAYSIDVPNGRWTLGIMPRGGWQSSTTLVAEIVATTGVAALVGLLAFVLLNQPRILQATVKLRTQELAEASLALEKELREHQAAAEQLRKLSRALEQSPASVVITDTEGRIEYVNPGFTRVSGYAPEEVIGQKPSMLKSGQTPPGVYESLWARIGAGENWRGELLNRAKNGELYWELAVISPVRNAEGEVTHFVGVMEDITARKRAEEEMRRLNRTLRVLSGCNQSLVHATSEDDLLERICSNLINLGGHRLAWVGFADGPAAATVRIVASAGFDEGYLARLSDDDRGAGLSGLSIREQRVIVVPRIDSDPLYARSRDEALRRGYASAIALPVSGAGIHGVLRITSAEPDAFNDAEVRLLRELADDLAFGIVALRTDAARHEAESALRVRNRAIEASLHGVMISDVLLPDHPIVYVNPSFERITGYTSDEALGRNGRFLFSGELEQPGVTELQRALRERRETTVEVRNFRKSGQPFWNEVSVAPVRDENGRVTHFISLLNDITQRKRYEEQLARQANHDALTGLANRNLLSDRIQRAILHAHRAGHQVAVMMLDLDNFKFVNDSLGHSVGDSLLIQVARLLDGCVRESDTVARLGGDEFAIVLTDLGREDDVAPIAVKIIEGLSRPLLVAEREVVVTGSMGISLYPRDGEQAEILLKNADAAMYRAKQQGRNAYCAFTPEMRDQGKRRLDLETDLRGALRRGELLLHYQPKVDIYSGRIIGAEALLRWQHPTRGLVLPMEFIRLAEETGLVLPIGEWVLRSACAQASAWCERLGKPVTVAVNLSARQFQQADLIDTVASALRDSGIDPALVELEITETMMMHDPTAAAATLAQIKVLGVKLSLDDFGTGYSSLSYLKRFPIDSLKIDRSFVRDLRANGDDAAIATAIIALARSLGLKVVAEGVETTEQLDFLRAHGCDAMQGYFFSRPVTPEAFFEMAREDASLNSSLAA